MVTYACSCEEEQGKLFGDGQRTVACECLTMKSITALGTEFEMERTTVAW